MKVTRTEKIWVAVVVVLYIAYNIPGVPPYNQAIPTLIHAALTVAPLWLCVYFGLTRVYKIYKIKKQ